MEAEVGEKRNNSRVKSVVGTKLKKARNNRSIQFTKSARFFRRLTRINLSPFATERETRLYTG